MAFESKVDKDLETFENDSLIIDEMLLFIVLTVQKI